MELINNQYVRFNRIDIFNQMLKASDEKDDNMEIYFHQLVRTLLDYEKENREHIRDIYISKDSLYIQEILESLELPIRRQTLLNASLFATYKGDIDISLKLNLWLSKKEVFPNELGELLDYVLRHSMDINEYFDGEKTRIIYNDTENKLEKGYVFQNKKSEKYRRLELK